MLPKSKVDLYAAIRRDARTGMSLRALMRKYGVGYETVQRALISALPEPRKKMRPRATRLDPYKPVIDAILKADLTAPRKQRHTVKRIYDRLLDEHDAVDISYQMVRAYVAARREEIRRQAGKGVADTFVPQTHRAGAEAEVDFGDVTVKLAGELVTCYLFAFRLSYSGKAVHRIFASAGQEAFFEGHVHALNVLGGVPPGRSATTTLEPPSPRCWASHAAGWKPNAGPPSAPTTASTPSTASPASAAPTRRAASRARSAGSAATTSSPSPKWTHSPSST
ncbi:hypothetical protein [Streptomyces flaveolus]|uniref:hypothetical protein n=1 Tax=Streptomyces flaveolus TaxID=67297 RepID=UPI0036FDB667